MRAVLVVLIMAIANSPTAAQRVGFHFGPLVATVGDDGWQESRFGLHLGASVDVLDSFQVAAFYVQKGRSCCRVHSVEVPLLYKRRLDQISYAVIGVAPSYGDYADVGVMAGLGIEVHRSENRVAGLEASFTYGLVRNSASFSHGSEKGHRVFRVALRFS